MAKAVAIVRYKDADLLTGPVLSLGPKTTRSSANLCAAALVVLAVAIGSPPAAHAADVRFTETLIYNDYTYPFGIQAADLDGDGDLDITSSDCAGHNNLYWFENGGKGSFTRHFIQKMMNDPQPQARFERHAIADVNADGHPDVVVIENLAGNVKWFENNGTPKDDQPWRMHVITQGTIPGAYDVAVADFDADGDLDVAAATWRLSNKFVWFENDGTPGDDKPWTERPIEENIAEPRMVCAADVDADGDPDVIGGARVAGVVVWYENTGKPATKGWRKRVIDDQAAWVAQGHPVDMDGDGDLDVVAASGIAATDERPGQVVWYENDGTPRDDRPWQKHVILKSFPHGFEAVAADLDGDGDMDVAATAWGGSGRLVWLENLGDPRGGWQMHTLKENWAMANQVIAADLDGDGDPDLAAIAERGALEFRWWRNEGPVAH